MTTQQTNERLVGDLNALGREAQDVLNKGAGQISEKAEAMRGRLAGAMEAAREAYSKLGERSTLAARATDRCIRDHPYETIGVALGLGLLVGLLVSRR